MISRDSARPRLWGTLLIADYSLSILMASMFVPHFGATGYAQLASVRSASSIIASFFGGSLVSRLGFRRIVVCFGLGYVGAFSILGHGVLPDFGQSATLIAIVGLCGGMLSGAASGQAIIAGKELPGVISTWHGVMVALQLAAPPIAGYLAGVSPESAVKIFAGVMLISTVANWILAPSQGVGSSASAKSFWRGIHDSLEFARATHWIRILIFIDVLQMGVAVPAWMSGIAILAHTKWPAISQGFVLASFAGGGLLAARYASKFSQVQLPLAVLIQGFVAAGLLAMVAVNHEWRILAAIAVLVGFCVRLGAVLIDQSISSRVPEEVLIESYAFINLASSASMPLGFAVLSFFYSKYSVVEVLLSAGGVSFVAVVVASTRFWRLSKAGA